MTALPCPPPPLGTLCSICRLPQFDTPGGPCCGNGHGGAEPLLCPPPPPALLPPPPPEHRAGTRLPAGLGWSTVLPDFDFETYSEAGYAWDDQAGRWAGPPGAPKQTRGLPLVGAEPYVRHHTFRIVWMSYDLKDGLGKRRWRPGLPPPADLLSYLAAGGLIEAHNSGFERWIWELHCVPKLGWPAVHERQWRCSMAKARASALPGSLGKLGEVLGISDQKDARGRALMKLLSMPRQPTQADPRRVQLPVYDQVEEARRTTEIIIQACMREPAMSSRKLAGVVARAAITAREEAEETEAYGQYCDTDIVAESQASALIPDLEGLELDWWITHERINRRGVHIDKTGVQNCIAVVEQVFAKYDTELREITGIDAASKVQQLQGWLRGRGQHLESLDEEAVEEALKNPILPPDVRRVLEIRAAAGSASVKKLYSILNRLSWDDRLRDLYIYFGARTGRSTGEGPQPTNLKKAGPDMVRCGLWVKNEFQAGSGCKKYFGRHRRSCAFCDRPVADSPRVEEWNPTIADEALGLMVTRSLEYIEYAYGEALAVIGGCLRALFDAAPGHDLLSTDYNSIEAVGLAELSGEAWRKEVFRDHGKIYEASASTMFGVPLDEILGWKKLHDQHHPLRAKGKIGELAFGYQGWIGSALAFDMPGTEDEIKQDILRWRAASPAVEWLWGGQEKRKAAVPVRNALQPGYAGAVADWARPLIYTERGDRSTYYFGVEGMAVLAMLEPDVWHTVTRLDGTDSGIAFMGRGDKLFCRIPSGRVLTYHSVVLGPSDRGGYSLSYMGWNTNPKNGPKGWIRMGTWGGRLVENINQATCREILRAACLVLEAAGYPVVLHVYDEIVAEVPEGVGSIEEFERLVTEGIRPLILWAADWPIRAPGGYRAKRYRKG